MSLISVLLGSFLTFDQLVHLEYHSYPLDWEEDGRPRGFFWFPPGWSGADATLTWLFSTPEWIRNDKTAKKLISLGSHLEWQLYSRHYFNNDIRNTQIIDKLSFELEKQK